MLKTILIGSVIRGWPGGIDDLNFQWVSIPADHFPLLRTFSSGTVYFEQRSDKHFLCIFAASNSKSSLIIRSSVRAFEAFGSVRGHKRINLFYRSIIRHGSTSERVSHGYLIWLNKWQWQSKYSMKKLITMNRSASLIKTDFQVTERSSRLERK